MVVLVINIIVIYFNELFIKMELAIKWSCIEYVKSYHFYMKFISTLRKILHTTLPKAPSLWFKRQHLSDHLNVNVSLVSVSQISIPRQPIHLHLGLDCRDGEIIISTKVCSDLSTIVKNYM
jgi:hypothetical protein